MQEKETTVKMDQALESLKDRSIETLSKSSLLAYPKQTENPPDFIRGKRELMEFFRHTDLGYGYMSVKILTELVAAKRDNIPEETLIAWYGIMIREGWTKADFDRRFNALMKSKTFGSVKIDDWYSCEPMYTEMELNVYLKREIENIYRKALACRSKTELTEDEQRAVKFAAARETLRDMKYEEANLMDLEKEKQKQAIKQAIRERRKLIAGMDREQRTKLLDAAVKNGELSYISEREKEGMIDDLQYYASGISMETIKEI